MVCLKMHLSIQLSIATYSCTAPREGIVISSKSVFLHTLQYMCVCMALFFSPLLFFFALGFLERITSFKEYEIQHLLKSDTLTLF